jgi:hypothetical protein
MTTTTIESGTFRVIHKTFHLGDIDGAEKAMAEAVAECRQAEADGLQRVAHLQTRLFRAPESGEGPPEEWIYEIHAQYRED